MRFNRFAAIVALSTAASIGFAQTQSTPQSSPNQQGAGSDSSSTTGSAVNGTTKHHKHSKSRMQDNSGGNMGNNGAMQNNGTMPGSGATPGNGTMPGNGAMPGNGTVPNNSTVPNNGSMQSPATPNSGAPIGTPHQQ